MALPKTTIPSDSDAVQAFNALLADNLVLFVVLGTGAEADTLVTTADQLAGLPTDPRQVFWAQRPAVLQTAVAGLPVAAGVTAPNLNTPDRAFVVSFSNVITDVIRAGEDADPTRVFQAYNTGN